VRILSGLYGVLRPLDLMHPYRLEMGTRLANPRGKDLYAFWGETVTRAERGAAATGVGRWSTWLRKNTSSRSSRSC
jgi:cytoplasmic iron level regulating protein YaaA (DUF328/UPF0246 family)